MKRTRWATVRRAAVLGAGTMGGQIAAHLANAGVPTLLLDVSAAAASEGLRRAAGGSPDPFFTRAARTLIDTASFDGGLPRLADADWIIESIVEDAEAKRALLLRIEPVRAPDAVVSTNTSGIPLSVLAAGLGDAFQRHWLGTHFFNPPRYLPLLEVIPARTTLPSVAERIVRFADVRLGKGVVIARDSPGFIANRIAIFGVARTLAEVAAGRATVSGADAMTGPLLGRPRSATFRTIDLAGVDVLLRVADDLAGRLPGETDRAAFVLPPFVRAMVERGWLGAKAGQGFYVKRASGEIAALDPASLSYEPAAPRVSGLDTAKRIASTAERLRHFFLEPGEAGDFVRATLGSLLVYAARVLPEVADSIDDVDRALRWGFGWELGPFETWDAIGIEHVIAACAPTELPPVVAEARRRGAFRPPPGPAVAFVAVPPPHEAAALLTRARSRGVVRRNAGASLVDLGEGVLLIELHSKLNVLGGDALQMIEDGVREAESAWQALVVGTGAANFSAGANLTLILLEAQDGNWDELSLMVQSFQRATSMMRCAAVPVVAAAVGLTLGGGCEICLHASHVEAAAESYLGLVETGVGLIPAGGGTKEMMARAGDALGPGADIQAASQQVFETLAFARVSGSAAHARELGYLRPGDAVCMNRERLLAAARRAALARAEGYVPAVPRPAIAVGGTATKAALDLGIHLARRAGRISEHDAVIGRALARVISGGAGGSITEQAMLDLEREAFLSLCGEPLTQQRIAHTLRTGKPLRN